LHEIISHKVSFHIIIQVTVAASPPFGGTKIDHPKNTLPLAVKCLEGTKSWAHFQIGYQVLAAILLC
jgi:hypothetical protein